MRSWIPLLLAGLVACGPSADQKIRVGAKDFAENRILAEAARQALAADGFSVAPVTVCGDTFGCQRALREGRVHVVPDYSGTGLFFLGETVPQGKPEATLDKVRAAYEPLGLSWRGSLGVDNGYRVYVTQARAQRRGWRTIEDLAAAGPLKGVCPPTYVRRPRDGMAALTERHGIRLAGQPLMLPDVADRVDALVDERVDFAVGYATDGAVKDRGLVALDDSLGFFPPYEASYLVRTDALTAHDGLGKSLARLEGRFDEAAMRRMNYRVEVEGRSPAEVAGAFLAELDLLPDDARRSKRAVVAVTRHEADAFGALQREAVRAVRGAYPARAVEVREAEDPFAEVAGGASRLALVGAERFFVSTGGLPVRDDRLEAVAVVGARWVHVLRKDGKRDLSGRVGLGVQGSGAALIGAQWIAQPALSDSPKKLVAALNAGQVDAIMLVGEPGMAEVKSALSAGAALVPVSGLSAERAPFLRPARLPLETYPGQTAALDTYTSQVVLAAPAREPSGLAAGGGPAAALPSSGLPMSLAEARAIADGTGVLEAPDPALPSAFSPLPRPSTDDDAHAVGRTALNVLAVLFLVWIGLLMRRKPDPEPEPDSETA